MGIAELATTGSAAIVLNALTAAKEREIEGVREALEQLRLKEGLILTYNQDEEISVGDKKIRVMPVWKWLLG